jgi:hypothetical protein
MYKLFPRVLTAALLIWSAGSHAAFFEYTDYASWDNDADRYTHGDWDLYITGSNGIGSWDGSDGINDVIIFTNLDTGQPPLIFADTFVGSQGSLSLGTGNVLAAGGAGLQIDLPGFVDGFALDLRGYYQAATTFNITLSTGDNFSTTVTNPNGGFWGILSTETFTSITFQGINDIVIMDYWAVSSVPAPGGLMVLVGLIGLCSLRFKSSH